MFVRKKCRGLFLHWACLLCPIILSLCLLLAGTSFSQETLRKVISRTSAGYPDLAKKMNLSGKVKIEVVVNPAGSVTSAKFVGGNPVFETNAVDAVKQWKFEPAATTTKGIITLEFEAH